MLECSSLSKTEQEYRFFWSSLRKFRWICAFKFDLKVCWLLYLEGSLSMVVATVSLSKNQKIQSRREGNTEQLKRRTRESNQ